MYVFAPYWPGSITQFILENTNQRGSAAELIECEQPKSVTHQDS